ncbi:hypothetical protein SCHPADRAFT_997980 [Schizopora paradoxa]|uniref:Uncharacterized protein n=1 Tax=Schizopora paradoxa TaxID=27342 RepID=A0A0H2RM42_9AGAM|nr:hypothetical protein SCHPADRAFT_997980 [Schizopora paradoxa]
MQTSITDRHSSESIRLSQWIPSCYELPTPAEKCSTIGDPSAFANAPHPTPRTITPLRPPTSFSFYFEVLRPLYNRLHQQLDRAVEDLVSSIKRLQTEKSRRTPSGLRRDPNSELSLYLDVIDITSALADGYATVREMRERILPYLFDTTADLNQKQRELSDYFQSLNNSVWRISRISDSLKKLSDDTLKLANTLQACTHQHSKNGLKPTLDGIERGFRIARNTLRYLSHLFRGSSSKMDNTSKQDINSGLDEPLLKSRMSMKQTQKLMCLINSQTETVVELAGAHSAVWIEIQYQIQDIADIVWVASNTESLELFALRMEDISNRFDELEKLLGQYISIMNDGRESKEHQNVHPNQSSQESPVLKR